MHQSGNHKRINVRFILLTFAASLVSTLLSPLTAAVVHAAAPPVCVATACGVWVSDTQIDYNGARFTEKQNDSPANHNGHMILWSDGYTGTGCSNITDKLDVGPENSSTPQPYQTATQADFTVYDCANGGTQATSSPTTTITLANTFNNRVVYVEWVGSTSLLLPGGGNNDLTFNEKSISNGTMVLTAPSNDPNSCQDESISIGTDTNTYFSARTAQLTTYKLETGNHCVGNTVPIDVLNSYTNVVTAAAWAGGAVDPLAQIILQNVSAADQPYGLQDGDVYIEPSDPSTPALTGANKDNMLLVSTPNNSCGAFQMHVQPYKTAATATITVHFQRGTGVGCDTKSITVALTNGYGGINNGNPGTTDPSQTDGCPVPADDGWRWFTCPIFSTLDFFTQAMYGLVSNMATIPVGAFFSVKSESVFNGLRDMGLGIVAIAGILMAINEAIGRDAYRVRKTAPILFFTAVAIAIIWPAARFGLNLTNDLTFWTGRIFMSIAGTTNSGGGIGDSIGIGLGTIGDSVLALLGGTALFGFLGLFGVLSLLLSAGIALIFACFVFVARDAILFGLLLASALLFALNALEFSGPKKVAKFCGDATIVTAMVGPAATGLLGLTYALSHLFVLIGGFGPQITAILIQIFGIGAVIKVPSMVGGAIGAVHSIIDGTRQGGVGKWLHGFRERSIQQNTQKFIAGERYLGNHGVFGRLGSGTNRVGAWTGAFLGSEDKVGYLLNHNNAQRAQRTAHERQQTAKYAQQPGTQASQNNDDMLMAQTYQNADQAHDALSVRHGWNEGRANRAIQAAMQQGGFGVTRQRYAVDQLAKNGTSYRNAEDMLTTIARVAGNDRQTIEDLVGSARVAAEGAGRLDLKGGSFTDMANIAGRIAANGNLATPAIQADIRRQVTQAAMGVDNVTAMRQKLNAIDNFAEALTQTADEAQAIADGTTRDARGNVYGDAQRIRAGQEAGLLQGQIVNMQRAAPYASVNNTRAFLERTSNVEMRYNGNVSTLPKMGVELNNPNFDRENINRINAAATQAANAQAAILGKTEYVTSPSGQRVPIEPTPAGAMLERVSVPEYPNNPNNPNRTP